MMLELKRIDLIYFEEIDDGGTAVDPALPISRSRCC